MFWIKFKGECKLPTFDKRTGLYFWNLTCLLLPGYFFAYFCSSKTILQNIRKCKRDSNCGLTKYNASVLTTRPPPILFQWRGGILMTLFWSQDQSSCREFLHNEIFLFGDIFQ